MLLWHGDQINGRMQEVENDVPWLFRQLEGDNGGWGWLHAYFSDLWQTVGGTVQKLLWLRDIKKTDLINPMTTTNEEMAQKGESTGKQKQKPPKPWSGKKCEQGISHLEHLLLLGVLSQFFLINLCSLCWRKKGKISRNLYSRQQDDLGKQSLRNDGTKTAQKLMGNKNR